MLLYEYNLTGSSPRKENRKKHFRQRQVVGISCWMVWMRQQSSVHFFTSAFGIYGFGLCASCASQWVFFLLHFTSIRLEKCQNQNKSNSERGGNKSKRRRIGRKNSPHGIFDKIIMTHTCVCTRITESRRQCARQHDAFCCRKTRALWPLIQWFV